MTDQHVFEEQRTARSGAEAGQIWSDSCGVNEHRHVTLFRQGEIGSSAGSFGGTPTSWLAISPMLLKRPAAYARLSVSGSGLPGCRMKGAAMNRSGAAATHCWTTAGSTPLRKAFTMW
jgi:hypothetical protein